MASPVRLSRLSLCPIAALLRSSCRFSFFAISSSISISANGNLLSLRLRDAITRQQQSTVNYTLVTYETTNMYAIVICIAIALLVDGSRNMGSGNVRTQDAYTSFPLETVKHRAHRQLVALNDDPGKTSTVMQCPSDILNMHFPLTKQ